MKSNYYLLFYLRKPKNYKDGDMAIYMRITVNGRRADISIGRTCDPIRWNKNGGNVLGSKAEYKAINNYIETIRHNIKIAHQILIETNQTITTETLVNQFNGKTQKKRYLMELFTEHNDRVRALIGNGFELNTLKGYNTTKKHLTNFLQKNYKEKDIEINELNHEFITDFEFYLKSDCKCTAVSSAKYIKHLKKIVNHCLANKWLLTNPFMNYKLKAKAKERSFLTQRELDAIVQKYFSVDRLRNVRDIFIFCCYTGLSYADVKKLKRTEISTGVDGEQWIFTQRQKTDTASRIPLLPIAKQIIDKYQNHPVCCINNLVLPVLTNQKMNSYLKEIADLCGIDKLLTFHIARHTFATTITLSNGVPIESVSKMLGHTNIQTTQHYAKILDNKIGKDMANLMQRYKTITDD